MSKLLVQVEMTEDGQITIGTNQPVHPLMLASVLEVARLSTLGYQPIKPDTPNIIKAPADILNRINGRK